MAEVGDPPSREAFAALRCGAAITLPGSRTLLEVRGEDRGSFLQGMLSNDVSKLAAGQGIHALLLTEQGRIVAEMVVCARAETLRLDMPRAASDAARTALERFIVADDVEIHPLALVAVDLRGPRAAQVLAAAAHADTQVLAAAAHADTQVLAAAAHADTQVLAAAAHADTQVLAAAGARAEHDPAALPECGHFEASLAGVPAWIVHVTDLGLDGFRVWVEATRADDVLAALSGAGATRVAADVIEVQRIVAGSPREGVDYDAQTLAPEVPAFARAISYRKGCYLGQEVVERVAARGHVNWLLTGLRAEDGRFGSGARVRADGNEVGHVTSAAVRPDDGACVAIARLRRTASAPGTRVTVLGEAGEIAAEVAQAEGA